MSRGASGGKPLSVPPGARAIARFAGGWTLYELPLPENASASFLWRPFKLMLPPETPRAPGRRRAYLLTWNADALRMRRDHDSHALELTHPDLFMRVETLMSLSYDRDWLVSSQGVTVAEIEAERGRMVALARERRAFKRAMNAGAHSS